MSRHPWLSFILLLLLVLAGFFGVGRVSAQTQSPIYVTTPVDGINENGLCSLREAVLAANTDTQVDSCRAGSGADTIILPAGTFQLSLAGPNEDMGLTGDLDVYSDLRIYGFGAGSTVIDGGQQDRVFHLGGDFIITISNLTIQNGAVPGELSGSGGGGIMNQARELWLHGVTVSGNSSLDTGGGIDNFGGILNILDSSFANNHAKFGGGIYSDGTLTVYRSVFTGNTAVQTGGAIDNNNSAGLYNVTISGNQAPTDPAGQGGGGIFNNRTLQLENVTLVNNLGSGGFMNSSVARATNSLFAQNENGNCTGLNAVESLGNNLDDGDSCGFTQTGDISGQAANIDVLADNGGFTQTHALQPESPAVDAGNTSSCQKQDQRGATRPADGDGDGNAVCDIGAFEFNAAFNTVYMAVIMP